MSECGENDLRIAREAANMPRWQAAKRLGISESNLARWENGEALPRPDDVSRMESIYGAAGLWYRWMYSNIDSFRDHFPPQLDLGLMQIAVMNVRHQLADVLAIQDAVERDALDGRIDDEALKANYLREIDEAQAALNEAKERLK